MIMPSKDAAGAALLSLLLIHGIDGDVAAPSHSWDFRGCSGSVTDEYSGLHANLMSGASCSADGVSLDGSSGYVQVDSWTWGGSDASIEVFVKLGATSNYARVFDFGNTDLSDKVQLSLDGSSTNAFAERKEGMRHAPSCTHVARSFDLWHSSAPPPHRSVRGNDCIQHGNV